MALSVSFPCSFKLWLVLIIACLVGVTSAQLSTSFYDKTCPKALRTIRKAVEDAVSNERRMGASLLRLHFHDCFVQASASHLINFTHHTILIN